MNRCIRRSKSTHGAALLVSFEVQSSQPALKEYHQPSDHDQPVACTTILKDRLQVTAGSEDTSLSHIQKRSVVEKRKKTETVSKDTSWDGNSAIAGTGSLGTGRLGPQIHALTGSCAKMARASLIERQLLRNGGEQFPNVRGGLCGRLEEEQTGLAGVRLCVGGLDGTLVWVVGDKVELIPCKSDNNVLVCLSLEFLHPRLGLVKRGLYPEISHVSLRQQRAVALRSPTA